MRKIDHIMVSLTCQNPAMKDKTAHTYYQRITDAYQTLLNSWFANSTEEIDDSPFIESYLNDCTSLPESQWLTDLCVPLKS